MNGPTATSKLKHELDCKIPVVGLTGNVTETDVKFFLNHGVVEVLVKPVAVINLKEMMVRVFKRNRSFSPLSSLPSSPTLSSSSSSSSLSSLSDNPLTLNDTNSNNKTNNKKASKVSRRILVVEGQPQQVTQEGEGEREGVITDQKRHGDAASSIKSTESNQNISNHQNTHDIRVLVVDDVASTRKVICRLLKNCGCITAEASDGQECLDIISRKKDTEFDLILMDYEMPIMNGPTATSKLKHELGSKIPVVGVTGNVLKADTDFFIEQGALEVLHKPLNVKMVKDLLYRILDKTSFTINNNATKTNNNNSNKLVPVPKYSVPTQTSTSSRYSDNDHDEQEWFMMALNV
eukprot:CAMPEP_0114345714 /NCGR_PEP_ID=MMETSP0101-20121206/12471_1 /TAXON_ID=38822 ORGANISM="Pteridomonas danica, Strain PT" /NCGR_SAMPLE_ID=MMETSP0101 /ASSEMBLY_ACC=CAM_ASM_000211 /LENGTH=348 /DNA_ID=CAMNT_0001481889 /DNA_START=706 /DNA_END=1752 /DNA_ORIENTATION=-